jgi:hypothetical protein
MVSSTAAGIPIRSTKKRVIISAFNMANLLSNLGKPSLLLYLIEAALTIRQVPNLSNGNLHPCRGPGCRKNTGFTPYHAAWIGVFLSNMPQKKAAGLFRQPVEKLIMIKNLGLV